MSTIRDSHATLLMGDQRQSEHNITHNDTEPKRIIYKQTKLPNASQKRRARRKKKKKSNPKPMDLTDYIQTNLHQESRDDNDYFGDIPTKDKPDHHFRIISHNVQNLQVDLSPIDRTNEELNKDHHVAKLIKSLNPDIYCMQEHGQDLGIIEPCDQWKERTLSFMPHH